MLFKFIYSTIIIGCSSLLGLIFANTYTERTRLLGALISTLQMLETEILYSATPIPVLLERVGNKSDREIKDIFLHTSDLLGRNFGQTLDEVWSGVVSKEAENTHLSREDINLLLSLGKNLGISNSQDQVKHIRLVQEEFKRHYKSALIEEGKNVKLFKNLGFLLGTAIVIIFF